MILISGCFIIFVATPPLESVIADSLSDENVFKFGNSNSRFEIIFMKQPGIVWESVGFVSEKLSKSVESIDAVCASPLSWL